MTHQGEIPAATGEAHALDVASRRLAPVEALVSWLSHRCSFAPPCGRCTYCLFRERLEDALGDQS